MGYFLRFPAGRIVPDGRIDKGRRLGTPRIGCNHAGMADQLYDSDILVWAERQADLLRRMARGERVNDVDWEHVAEEIEDVGRSELHVVESYRRQILVHLLKIHASPDDPAVRHWRGEIVAFQQNMDDRFTPSMRQRIDLVRLYRQALQQVEDDEAEAPAPRVCPFTLDQLLTEKRAELERRLSQAGPE